MNTKLRTFAVASVIVIGAANAGAQGGGGGGRAARIQQQLPPGRGAPPEQRLGQLAKTQLQLSDAQTTRLQETLRKFRDRRFSINEEEGQVRRGMRDMLCSADTTRGADVARSLDQLADLQRRRMQLFDEEQRDLATFLNPYQRAKWIGLQERAQDLLGGPGGGGRGGRGRAGPPPGGPPPDSMGPPPGGQGQRRGPPPDGMRRGGPGGPPGLPAGC